MDWVFGGLILCAAAIGILGITELIVFLAVGAAHTAFIVLALAQAGFAAGLAVCIVISFIYIMIIIR